MKAWMGAACLLAASQGLWAQSVAPVDTHDAYHQQPPAAAPLGKTGPTPHEKRKQGVSPAYARQWREALARADRGDAAEAGRALADVLAHREFATLSAGEQRATWSRAAWMAVALDDHAHARAMVEKAIAADPNDADDLYLLLQLEDHAGERSAAARHLHALVRRWPRMLDHLDIGVVQHVAHQAPDDDPVRWSLLEALLEAGWDGHGLGIGDLWYQLALHYLANGNAAGVRRAAALTTSPQALVKFRVDRRFDALLDRGDAALDVTAAAERRLDHLRRLANERPKNLEVRMELSYALLTLGRYAEVVTLADDVVAARATASPDAPAFDDPSFAAWIVDNRATARRALGTIDQAQADLILAVSMADDDAPNVGHALNLGDFLCQRGRPEEALAAIGDLDDGMSDYGRMVQASIRHCAALQQEDAASARRELRLLRERREQGMELWIWALVEADRLDEAASALIAGLEAPESRGEMLAAVQDYRELAPLPAFQPVVQRWRDLLMRADVQQAIANVGRIERYPIFRAGGG